MRARVRSDEWDKKHPKLLFAVRLEVCRLATHPSITRNAVQWCSLEVIAHGNALLTVSRAGLEVYVVSEVRGSNRGGLVMLPDVYGVNSGRTKQICDLFSRHGYVVCMPDLFHGEPPLSGDSNLLMQAPAMILALRRFPPATVSKEVMKINCSHSTNVRPFSSLI